MKVAVLGGAGKMGKGIDKSLRIEYNYFCK